MTTNSNGLDIMSQVAAVNELLLTGEPHNISIDDYSGYVGYKPQFIIDAMNEVFGIGGWGFEELSSEIVGNDKGQLAIAQVKVWLKDIAFMPAAWGQSRVTKGDIGDAKKGAQTDAIKKALSYFSIGNRAYQGLLKEGSQAQSNTGEALATIKAEVKELGLVRNPAQWLTWKKTILGRDIPDNKIAAGQIAKLQAAIEQVKQSQAA